LRIHCETFGEAAKRLGEWHNWFAWHPIFIPKVGIIWLETTERRCSGIGGFMDAYLVFEYRIKETS